MYDEQDATMEKKIPSRQSPCLTKNGLVSGEKKSDNLSNKNGRQKKYRESNSGGRVPDLAQLPNRTPQKYNRSVSDKRPRQRGYSNYRQGEEVADPFDLVDQVKSRKASGNANHLLHFNFPERGFQSQGSHASNWSGRRVHRHQNTRYKKEQYLQSSCQFVVCGEGDYSEQAINPDALVDWDRVQLVRTFSTEIVVCPICLDVPVAGKITQCGHTYCWSCILHHLHVNGSRANVKCPVCPDYVDADTLRSVQNILLPDYKVGDEIEMRLMRKSKGSVFVCAQDGWSGTQMGHLNMDDGDQTKFAKLLTASGEQIQVQVLDRERDALARAMAVAEPDELFFMQMAQGLLEEQVSKLKLKLKQTLSSSNCASNAEKLKENKAAAPAEIVQEVVPLPRDVSFDGSKIRTQYTDAFDQEEEESFSEPSVFCDENDTADLCNSQDVESLSYQLEELASVEDGEAAAGETVEVEGSGDAEDTDVASNAPRNSSPTGEGSLIAGIAKTLTPEEAADHLELPELSELQASSQHKKKGPKDTFHFYQASSGQHMYMNTVNAQCLAHEYGGQENGPTTVTATIVAIERIFMTEEMRKRLRYLNHLPLTTEFHVVELKIRPPVVSKETIKHFQHEFDKRRKIRQKKAKEEKVRANKNEIEHKKAFGLYEPPEIRIPLDNSKHFPSHHTRQRKESVNSDIFHDSGLCEGHESPVVGSPVSVTEAGTSPTLSFAQKLASSPSAGSFACAAAWPRVGGTSLPSAAWPSMAHSMAHSLAHSATMPEMRNLDADEVEGEAYRPPSMALAWQFSMDQIAPEPTSPSSSADQPETSSGKKKKKKSKQVLFSTSMARKN